MLNQYGLLDSLDPLYDTIASRAMVESGCLSPKDDISQASKNIGIVPGPYGAEDFLGDTVNSMLDVGYGTQKELQD